MAKNISLSLADLVGSDFIEAVASARELIDGVPAAESIAIGNRKVDFYPREFAEQQENAGASILDVNMGMGGVDEKALMVKAVEELTQITNLPLSLDSSVPEVLEAALRIYPGRALVNSVSLEEVKIKQILPLVKKYGAMFILLPLSDEGLPKDDSEKNHIRQNEASLSRSRNRELSPSATRRI